MRIRSWMGLVTASLAVFAAAAPAAATHNGERAPDGCRYIRGMATPENHDDDVYVCRQETWFHKAETRVANLAGLEQDEVPSWSTTAPTGSLQESGAVYAPVVAYDAFVEQSPLGRALFEGSFTGTMDSLAIRMFLRAPVDELPADEVTGESWPAFLHLEVDGEILFDNFDTAPVGLPLKPAGDLQRVDIAFDDLYELMDSHGLPLHGGATHDISIAVAPWYFADRHTVFFFDALEAPSGLVFNTEPASLSGFTNVPL